MSFLSGMTWPQSWPLRFSLSLRTFGLVLILIVMIVTAIARPEKLLIATFVVIVVAHVLAGFHATWMRPGAGFWSPGRRDDS